MSTLHQPPQNGKSFPDDLCPLDDFDALHQSNEELEDSLPKQTQQTQGTQRHRGHRDTADSETQQTHHSREDCVPVSGPPDTCVPQFILAAWHVSRSKPLPPEADRYYLPGMRSLVALCSVLQAGAREGRPFILACRHAGAVLAVDYRCANRWLKRLELDGLLARVETGSKASRRANRYRFVGKGGPNDE
jgi:hypothetical protein